MVYIQALATSTTPLNTLSTSTRPGSVNHRERSQAIPSVATTSSDPPSEYITSGDTTTSLTDTSDPDVAVATSVQTVTVSSVASTQSLIQITALPPATTSPQTVVPKLAYDRQFNIIYLTPLFVALGAVLGVVAVVLWFRWRTNRRRWRRNSTLQPGPPYVPPENDVEDRLLVHGSQSMEQVSLFAASTPSKFTVHGSRYTPQRSIAWPTFGRDQPFSYSQPLYTETIVPSIDGERFTVLVQDDPFLVTRTGTMQQSPKDFSLPRIHVSLSMQEPGDDPTRHQETDPSSPKSFRRSMFDILKLRSPYKPVPNTHSDSKMTRVLSLSDSANATGGQRPSLEGNLGASGTQDSMIDIDDMADGKGRVGGLGILPNQEIHFEEAILTTPKRGEKAQKPRVVTPYPSETQVTMKERENVDGQSESSLRGEQIDEEQSQDIYTEAPERRRSRPPSQKSMTGASRRSSASDAHASVLPLSPPSLMSPPLEKSLFFTSLSCSTSLGRVDTLPMSSSSTPRTVNCSPETSLFPLPSRKTKTPKKLRTGRSAPPLPYPSYPDGVDAQSTSRDGSTSTEFARLSVSPGSPKPKGRSTSATSRETTNGMWSHVSLSPTTLALALVSSPSDEVLSKVNDIVAQGYNMKRTAEVDSVDGQSE